MGGGRVKFDLTRDAVKKATAMVDLQWVHLMVWKARNFGCDR